MQKSKSLSNVGQFVSRKIWGSRSKCQNRQNHSQDFAPQRQKWTPLVRQNLYNYVGLHEVSFLFETGVTLKSKTMK